MARSGSDPFPITLPERVNDRSKAGRVLLQSKRPHLYRPKSGGRPRFADSNPKFGIQTLPAQLRDGEATGPLLDQPQHDKSLEASGIRLRLAMSKVEQLADFARAQRRGQTSNHVGAPCSPMAAYEDRHRAHCLDQCLRSGSVVISQPRQPEALFRGEITFV
jgi:hypothetical protein